MFDSLPNMVSESCSVVKVTPEQCTEALRVEQMADRDEFRQPAYPVEKQELKNNLIHEISALSRENLRAVALVHEHVLTKQYQGLQQPPNNGGVYFDAAGRIAGLTFNDRDKAFDITYDHK